VSLNILKLGGLRDTAKAARICEQGYWRRERPASKQRHVFSRRRAG